MATSLAAIVTVFKHKNHCNHRLGLLVIQLLLKKMADTSVVGYDGT